MASATRVAAKCVNQAMLSCAQADDSTTVATKENDPAAKENNLAEQLPPGVTLIDEKEPVPSNSKQLEQFVSGGGGFIPTGGITYRWRYTYPYRGGFRYGWRYPIGYWNSFGRSIYGPSCFFGRTWGGFYYSWNKCKYVLLANINVTGVINPIMSVHQKLSYLIPEDASIVDIFTLDYQSLSCLPDRSYVMDSLLQNELMLKSGEVVSTSQALDGKKIIGFYFSGSYCPPCRKFTPLLDIVYNNIKKAGHDDVEIIFISSDKEEAKFTEYYDEMPWIALPYKRRDLKLELCEKFGIKTVPTLIFFNERGEVVEREGRHFITDHVDDIDGILAHLRQSRITEYSAFLKQTYTSRRSRLTETAT
ncbi:Thioredoxin, nucleoredoxin and related proteins [Plasmopara halstedii]|uniref:protein-disulfide reductase n=1 Tax=Plasmopara halstedii TaxID=4781 RepID=A0A0P1ATX2_PLAHL|nr:Thioredoxin, nucleoredoxin and related proteins [Plasmopara halstedii]CEG44800.1 Thioredoxin, nucleoredoxin and related proteins [Plasmopara halstedii]|eukprot:XP_024581169.1 Thioredoxin, nucleoredoxin and related proteins [Plasmopara halstedii]